MTKESDISYFTKENLWNDRWPIFMVLAVLKNLGKLGRESLFGF